MADQLDSGVVLNTSGEASRQPLGKDDQKSETTLEWASLGCCTWNVDSLQLRKSWKI